MIAAPAHLTGHKTKAKRRVCHLQLEMVAKPAPHAMCTSVM